MPLPSGADAPAFDLPADDGGKRSLEDLTGQGAALLGFFKTSCPTCGLTFPIYGELERRFGQALPVVAVSQDPLETAVPWLEERGFTGPVLDDSADGFGASKAYEVATVPTLVLVDGGQVVATSEGWDRQRFNQWAEELGARTGGDTSAVSTDEDGRPAFRPG